MKDITKNYSKNEENKTDSISAESVIEISKDGPILVYGNITIKKHDGA